MKAGGDNHANLDQSGRVAGDSIVLSPAFLSALARVEALPSNRDHADKSWVSRALDDARRHFARARKA